MTFRDKIWDIKVRKKWCKKIKIAAAAQRNHHRRWWWHWEKSYELQIFVMDDDPQTSQHGIRALWPRNLSKFDEIFKYLPNKNEWRKCMHLGNCRSQVKKRSKYEMTQALTIMRCDLNFHKWHPYCTLAMSGSITGGGGYSGSWIWFEKIYLAYV